MKCANLVRIVLIIGGTASLLIGCRGAPEPTSSGEPWRVAEAPGPMTDATDEAPDTGVDTDGPPASDDLFFGKEERAHLVGPRGDRQWEPPIDLSISSLGWSIRIAAPNRGSPREWDVPAWWNIESTLYVDIALPRSARPEVRTFDVSGPSEGQYHGAWGRQSRVYWRTNRFGQPPRVVEWISISLGNLAGEGLPPDWVADPRNELGEIRVRVYVPNTDMAAEATFFPDLGDETSASPHSSSHHFTDAHVTTWDQKPD